MQATDHLLLENKLGNFVSHWGPQHKLQHAVTTSSIKMTFYIDFTYLLLIYSDKKYTGIISYQSALACHVSALDIYSLAIT